MLRFIFKSQRFAFGFSPEKMSHMIQKMNFPLNSNPPEITQ